MKSFFVKRSRQRLAATLRELQRRDLFWSPPQSRLQNVPDDAEMRLGVVTSLHSDAKGIAESNSARLKSLGCTILATSGVKLGDMYLRTELIEATMPQLERVRRGLRTGELHGMGHLVILPATSIWTLSALCPAADDAESGTSTLVRSANLNICFENRFEARGPQTGIRLLHQYLLIQAPEGMSVAKLDALTDVFECSFGGTCEVTPGASLAVLSQR